MVDKIETVIVGAGQAGLATSYYLKQRNRSHIVLERDSQPVSAWRKERWDSFTLVTPNWTMRLPGYEYDGPDPDGFMPRDEIVACFDRYVERFSPPVQCGVQVTSVEPGEGGYRVETSTGVWQAANVVMATGVFQKPRLMTWSAGLPAHVTQIPSTEYRNPQSLPPGAVLVVGSGQSGCQIAEDLYLAGRKVYLCIGGTGRLPRRYRGKDGVYWLTQSGFMDRTPDKLPSPRARFMSLPQLSGARGGHSLNLHQFVRDGVTLLGRIKGAEDGKVRLAPDLKASLTQSDRIAADLIKMIDAYIEKNGLDAPPETLEPLRDGYDAEEILELDLDKAGISTIIWACGFTFDYSLVKLPVVDDDGYPIQQRGVSAYRGLYFAGMPWMDTPKTGILVGMGDHAGHIASVIDQVT